MYKVIEKFIDLQDNSHLYNVGDEYPHDNVAVSAERIKELSTTKNKRGKRLIREIDVLTSKIEKAEEIKPQSKKRKRT